MLQNDKRWATRSPLWLRTTLFVDRKFSRFGLAADFSLQGLFLICNTSGLKLGQIVEVDFRYVDNGIEKICYVSTEIVRIARDGVGVSFNEFNSNHFSCLHSLIMEQAKYGTGNNINENAKIAGGYHNHAA